MMPYTMLPSQEQNIKPLHDRVYETVAQNYKPRYAYQETGEQNPKGHQMPGTIMMLFNFLCSYFRRSRSVRSSICIFIIIAGVSFVLLNRLIFLNPLKRNVGKSDKALANRQSNGLFQDFSKKEWSKMQEDTRQSRDEQGRKTHWFTGNKRTWHTDFKCPQEQIVGGNFFGRGGITICNPSGIQSASEARAAKGQNGCLVYTSYNRKIDLKFEKALLDLMETCEIHVFNKFGLVGDHVSSDNIHLHAWKLESSTRKNQQQGPQDAHAKSLQESIQLLGHDGMSVDLFLLDCAACELDTVEDWFDNNGSVDTRQGVNFLQIMAMVHSARYNVMEHFFGSIEQQGYVTYYKGRKEKYPMRWYGFLKLAPDYFIR